jgi:hypothetical protein
MLTDKHSDKKRIHLKRITIFISSVVVLFQASAHATLIAAAPYTINPDATVGWSMYSERP